MSMRQTIWDAIQYGQLHELEPRSARAPRIRSMYLTEDLLKTVRDETLPHEHQMLFAEVEATLADFITSRTLDPEYIKLLWPHEDCVWEIRCMRPDPTVRVFGFFADRDAFVATNYELRPVLGKFESGEWKFAKTRARYIWRRLFGPLLPRNETDAKLLISGAIDAKFFQRS
jgi:hypothetical protein